MDPTTPPQTPQPPQQPPATPNPQPIPPQPPVGPVPPQPEQQPATTLSPQPTTDTYNAKPKSSKKGLVIFLIILVVLLAAGAAAYWWFYGKNGGQEAYNAAKQASQSISAKDISKLNSVSMNPPVDLKGYAATSTARSTVAQYVSADKTCLIQFGTLTATDLPGSDIGDIVDKQITELKKTSGFTYDTPKAGDALVIKDANNANITYSIPTLVFTYHKEKTHAMQYYSAAILGNGDRAFVSRLCAREDNQPVSQEQLRDVEDLAKSVTVSQK